MGSEPIRLDVNGREVDLDVDPETPLLYVLRHSLGLKTARFGCGVGLCGACSVLVDGESVRSCDMPVWSAAGKRLVTVEGLAGEGLAGEGLAGGGEPNVLIEEIVAHQAAQCGYCLPGIVVSAQALLDRNQRPGRAEIAEALDGNLCRCGAHLRIMKAVERAVQRLAGDA